MRMGLPKLGMLVFLLTLPLAVVLGLLQAMAVDVAAFDIVLVLVGLVAGVLLITKKESVSFLVAVIALPIVAASLALLPVGLDLVSAVFAKIGLVAGATAAVVVVKVLYDVYKSK